MLRATVVILPNLKCTPKKKQKKTPKQTDFANARARTYTSSVVVVVYFVLFCFLSLAVTYVARAKERRERGGEANTARSVNKRRGFFSPALHGSL